MDKYVVTIAREFGSGGRSIGKMLSKRLGISYYDKDIVRIASDQSGISEGMFNLADERVRESIFKRSKQYTGDLITPDKAEYTSDDNLFNFQAKVINELADSEESCIIVGRCADYVLKDRKNVYRIFIRANEETCVKNVMNVIGVATRDEALKQVRNINKQRVAYYKAKTGRDWTSVENYDLIIDTTEMDFESCVELIADYIEIRQKLSSADKG